jgi:hypothetical protein
MARSRLMPTILAQLRSLPAAGFGVVEVFRVLALR